jgi:hypothetical protein
VGDDRRGGRDIADRNARIGLQSSTARLDTALVKVIHRSFSMPKVLDLNQSYTFSKYFDLPYAPEDILADLGCTLERTDIENLPYSKTALDWLPELAESIRRRLKRVNTTTEQARREALIFPVIDWICDQLNYLISIEYAISVTN